MAVYIRSQQKPLLIILACLLLVIAGNLLVSLYFGVAWIAVGPLDEAMREAQRSGGDTDAMGMPILVIGLLSLSGVAVSVGATKAILCALTGTNKLVRRTDPRRWRTLTEARFFLVEAGRSARSCRAISGVIIILIHFWYPLACLSSVRPTAISPGVAVGVLLVGMAVLAVCCGFLLVLRAGVVRASWQGMRLLGRRGGPLPLPASREELGTQVVPTLLGRVRIHGTISGTRIPLVYCTARRCGIEEAHRRVNERLDEVWQTRNLAIEQITTRYAYAFHQRSVVDSGVGEFWAESATLPIVDQLPIPGEDRSPSIGSVTGPEAVRAMPLFSTSSYC
ncbi:MAG: hypothetical protein Q4E00_10925 [Actinomyces bowdenii]|nr:hypothetical protein [Actinomyces bowdenii]